MLRGNCNEEKKSMKKKMVCSKENEPGERGRRTSELHYPTPYVIEPKKAKSCSIGTEIMNVARSLEPWRFVEAQIAINKLACQLVASEIAFLLFATKDDNMLYLNVMEEKQVGPVMFPIAHSSFFDIFQENGNKSLRRLNESHRFLFKRFSTVNMKTFLCVPYFYPLHSNTVAILICLMNKKRPVNGNNKVVLAKPHNALMSICEFTKSDEDILSKLLEAVGPVIMNSATQNWEKVHKLQKEMILDLAIVVSPLEQITEVIRSIMLKTRTIMGSESCSLMLIDDKKSEFLVKMLEGIKIESDIKDIRFSLTQGIYSQVAKSGIPKIVRTPFEIPYKNKKTNRMSKISILNMICFPIKHRGEVMAVVEFSNKLGDDNFTEIDKDLCTAFEKVFKKVAFNSLLEYLMS